MIFTKYNEQGVLVNAKTGAIIEDSELELNVSAVLVSNISMMDSQLKNLSPREVYILSLQGSPNFKGNGEQDVLKNYKESLKGLLKVDGNGLYAKPPSNGGVES